MSMVDRAIALPRDSRTMTPDSGAHGEDAPMKRWKLQVPIDQTKEGEQSDLSLFEGDLIAKGV